MSSYVSTVTISDAEWATIQQCVADTNAYVARQKERARRIQEETNRREQDLMKLQAELKHQTAAAAASLTAAFNKTLGDLERTSGDASKKQAETFEEGVADLREEIGSTMRKTAEVSRKVEHISGEYAQLVSELASRSAGAAEKAQAYMETIRRLSKQIAALYPSVFAPDKHRELLHLVASAEGNLAGGSFESALIAAQNGAAKASRLLVELIADNALFEQVLVETMERANALNDRFELLSPEMQGAIAFDLDGEKIEYPYDIDHWSEGRFAALQARFRSCFDQLQQAAEKKAPVKQLESIQAELSHIEELLTKCDVGARQELLGSLKVQEISARLCDSLMDNDWSLEEHGFAQTDDRNPYTMTYRNGAGNSISIIVSPGVSAEKPSIFLEAFTEEPAHSDIIKRNVHATLSNEGIAIEQTQQLADCQAHPNGDAYIRHTLSSANKVNQQRRQKSFR